MKTDTGTKTEAKDLGLLKMNRKGEKGLKEGALKGIVGSKTRERETAKEARGIGTEVTENVIGTGLTETTETGKGKRGNEASGIRIKNTTENYRRI